MTFVRPTACAAVGDRGLGAVFGVLLAAAILAPFPAAAAKVELPEILRAAPATKPTPVATAELASPFDDVGKVRGRSEGMAYLASLDPTERKELKREGMLLLGETDQDKEGLAGYIRAVVLFRQPKPRVYALMAEPHELATFLPRLDESEAVRQAPHEELTQFRIDFLFWDIRFQIQHWFYPELSRYEWALDSQFDHDIEENRGYWQLFAMNDRYTVGEYGVWVDTGIPFPQKFLEAIQRMEIPGAMRAFQRYIDSDGSYRKDE